MANASDIHRALRYQTLATQQSPGSLMVGGDHGGLTGLIDDDHTQYLHLDTARSITAQHTFEPGSAQAPFLLGANAQGQLVTGLNADLLDSLDSSSNPGATEKILKTDASGYLQLERLGIATAPSVRLHVAGATEQLRLEYNAGNYVSFTVDSGGGLTIDTESSSSGGNLTLQPEGDLVLGPDGNDVLPDTGYTVNLGMLTKKYLALHAAELWVETLVAQDTLATIGGRVLVGPTTTLTRDLAAAGTSMYVKHNQMAANDTVLLEANGSFEMILVTSSATVQPEGDYLYSITRNRDGSGANDWTAGDAVFNTGTTGDGFIDLYSIDGVLSGSGPTITGNVRNSTTYNDITPFWAIGNLNGLYGYGSDTYGAAFGKYASGQPWIGVDATNGLRIMHYTTQLAQWDTSGTIVIGEVAASKANIQISSGSITMRNNTTDWGTWTSAGTLRIGQYASGYGCVILQSTGDLEVRNYQTKKLLIDPTNNIMKFGHNIDYVYSTALVMPGSAQTYNGETLGAFDILFGDNSSSKANMLWDYSAGKLQFRGGTTMQAEIDTDGSMIAAGGAMKINASGIYGVPTTSWNSGIGFWFSSGYTNHDMFGLYADKAGGAGRLLLLSGGSGTEPNIESDIQISASNNGSLLAYVGLSAYSGANETYLKLYSNDGGSHYIQANRTFYINESSNAGVTLGLTINQGANDDGILDCKSSDIAHGITDITETDTYFQLRKASAPAGGAYIRGLTEDEIGILLIGLYTNANTTKTTSGSGAIDIRGYQKSGTGAGAMTANSNILTVRNHTTTRFILDADGDSHQDVGTAWTNFDDQDDIELLNRLSAHLTREGDPLRERFAGWLAQGREQLERLRLVTFNEDGHHFVNWSRMHMLEIGAVRQLAERLARLEEILLAN